MDFETFQHSHSSQLVNIPRTYWRALYEKLQVELYDAGKYFCMSHGEDGWQVLVSCKEGLKLEDPSCIFLVDHAWTFQAGYERKQLEIISGLAVRMATLMGLVTNGDEEERTGSYDADSESGNEVEEWSDSADEQAAADQSEPGISYHPHLVAEDGYGSGDLGDVSHAYITEGPDMAEIDPDASPLPVRTKIRNRNRDKRANLKRRGQDESPDEYIRGEEEKGSMEKENTCKVIDPESGEALEVAISLPSKKLVEDILSEMWKHCHAYHISNSLVPMWFVMDEFGSRIQQSTNPSVAMVPFFYIPTQLAYSVFWPIKELGYKDIITCNFLPKSVKPGLEQVCHSLPWSRDHHISLDDPLWSELDKFKIPEVKERCNEDIPDPATPSPSPMLNYNVYTDMKLVESFLTHPSFHLISSRKEADILWLSEHFKNFRSLQPGQFVNQFSCENVVTCKDLLVTVARRGNNGVEPKWLPLTFNLMYELPKFVRDFMEKKERGAEALWIVKPWNLGRSLDIHITDKISKIIRLAQAGPKIVSEYISRPVLFHRPDVGKVKFDYRYIVLLSSVQPLELYIYNVFWLRFANKPYTLDDLTDYEIHFTVMNYKPKTTLKQIHYNDFIPLFEEQYPDHKWSDIQEKTCELLKELFTSACSGEPPNSIAHCGQSKAIYAADLMLERVESSNPGSPARFEPHLLEINFCPDCVRACKYHPDFFNHIFEVLFMGTTSNIPVTRIA